jgi:hypothetical protein
MNFFNQLYQNIEALVNENDNFNNNFNGNSENAISNLRNQVGTLIDDTESLLFQINTEENEFLFI